MWFLFIVLCLIIAGCVLALIYFGNKVFIIIKKNNIELKYEEEEKEAIHKKRMEKIERSEYLR